MPLSLTCPKCGAPREERAAECLACGILFHRWMAANMRRAAFAPAPKPQKQPVDRTLLVAGAALVVLLGLVVFHLQSKKWGEVSDKDFQKFEQNFSEFQAKAAAARRGQGFSTRESKEKQEKLLNQAAEETRSEGVPWLLIAGAGVGVFVVMYRYLMKEARR